tara:strand:- start:10502 stop:10666 length:165 start_codon:yes stop_codon:yes gene_type:complete
MTEPIKLLEKRLSEIKNIKKDACSVSEEDAIKINHLYNEYYACIKLLKKLKKKL